MSPCNVINGITTTVIPPCSAYASNINNKLFPSSVSITATTGLSPTTIAATASFYTLRNSAVLPIIRYN
jgi:hypothetical protein